MSPSATLDPIVLPLFFRLGNPIRRGRSLNALNSQFGPAVAEDVRTAILCPLPVQSVVWSAVFPPQVQITPLKS